MEQFSELSFLNDLSRKYFVTVACLPWIVYELPRNCNLTVNSRNSSDHEMTQYGRRGDVAKCHYFFMENPKISKIPHTTCCYFQIAISVPDMITSDPVMGCFLCRPCKNNAPSSSDSCRFKVLTLPRSLCIKIYG